MIFPQVDIYIPNHNTTTFLEALKPISEALANESKCLSFEMFKTNDPSDSNVTTFRLLEVWDADEDWFMTVQAKKDYYKPYFEILERLSARPLVFGFWERVRVES